MHHHILVGRLTAAEYNDFGGDAGLTFELAQPDAARYTGQTIRCLMSYGRTPEAHAAAVAAVAQMQLGHRYRAEGLGIGCCGNQTWLFGVTAWAPVPATVELRFPHLVAA
jgi:hypothetical protein